MSDESIFNPGDFCWNDLSTPDVKGARKFYATVLGWEYDVENPDGKHEYHMIKKDGAYVGGAYTAPDPNIPPHWLPYIKVESAAETSAKAKELGGEVVMGPMDVFEEGKMSLIRDPQGAHFAIWEAVNHHGSSIFGKPGSACWYEINARDKKAVIDFYTKLFGWGTKSDRFENMPYTEFLNGEKSVGGLIEMNKEWGDMPSHWMTYFMVEDTDETVREIKERGGQVPYDPMDIPDVGRFAVAIDPFGAAFSVISDPK